MTTETDLIEKPEAESDVPAIRVRGLVTGFGPQIVHDHLDLDVKRGEILGVVGGSGTGKSVLLKAIIGLITPMDGEIEINGVNQHRLVGDAAQAARREWGVLFQDGALFTSLTVAQNVQVPLREHFRLAEDLMDDIARSKISMAGLPLDAACKYPSDLSGGMRKRAALARALALDPSILFLDEPTAGLDPIGASAFDQLILDLKAALGLTVFLVTHDLDTLHTICDRVAVIAEKKVLTIGTLDEVARFDHPWVRDYFSGPRARAAGITSGKAKEV
ncbi:ABC transporter ATP-binding protein [Gimibacter soli]|uniref:ATP-binding cassette domain-containing protein n=1 Tax=Gimibacter soli TaxID=3024400 RepID=A0AAE9XRF9_9PROT|nr:ATP-binding cassette domain-containing protein [Gimibacter soli]WCL54941.1 ATP-binding cassette domain-containing protein [Gimibacter soli]